MPLHMFMLTHWKKKGKGGSCIFRLSLSNVNWCQHKYIIPSNNNKYNVPSKAPPAVNMNIFRVVSLQHAGWQINRKYFTDSWLKKLTINDVINLKLLLLHNKWCRLWVLWNYGKPYWIVICQIVYSLTLLHAVRNQDRYRLSNKYCIVNFQVNISMISTKNQCKLRRSVLQTFFLPLVLVQQAVQTPKVQNTPNFG